MNTTNDATIKLMLIEDNDLDVEFVERLIRRLKNDVEVTLIHAKDGEHALVVLEQLKPPYAILVDINMPRMNGLQFLQLIAKHKEHKSVPCYVLSSSTLQQDIEDAAASGAQDFLIKPLTAEQLLSVVLNKKMS